MRHVACGSDAGYLPHVAAMVHSVLAHRGDEDVHVHYVHGPDLPEADGKRLTAMVAALGGQLSLHLVGDDRIAGLPRTDVLPRPMWYRTFLPELLPEVRQILYLDADTIVVDELGPLWSIDLGDDFVGAVTNVLEPWNAGYPQSLGLSGPEAYFNSGVLLMNLELMRREDAAAQVFAYARRATPQQMAWGDQCALNVVLGDRRRPLHPRWNCMNSVMTFPESVALFGAEAVAEARERPGIRHFEGPSVNKPWHVLCEHDLRELYLRHRQATPWPMRRPEGAGPRNTARRLARRTRRRLRRLSA